MALLCACTILLLITILLHFSTQSQSDKSSMHYKIILDTGASKSFTSKLCYLHCKSLHSLPQFASKTQKIQVGNGQFISVLFIIMITIDINGHRLEIYMLISERHENADLVLGIKNIFELEGIIDSWDCYFLNRLIPIFPKEHFVLKPREQ